MKRKWFQTAAGVLFAGALLFYPLYSRHFQLTVEQILGLFLGFGTFCFWYFDGRMDSVVKAVEDGLKGHIGESSLAQAIGEAAKIRKHWKKVRVLATSTGQIQPIFQSSGLEADVVEIVVRQIRPEEIARDRQLEEYQRALKRFHLFRDVIIPRCFTAFALIDAVPKSSAITHQLRRVRCANRATLIRS